MAGVAHQELPGLGVRVAQRLGAALQRWGVKGASLDADQLIQAARRKTGLEDFGEPELFEPLRQLSSCYDADRELTLLGRRVLHLTLLHALKNRLEITETLRRQPEILQTPVRRPIIVVGLPRTGTTFLYNLLAQDPAARPLLFWESMKPCPPPEPETRKTDPRIRFAHRKVRLLQGAVPALQAIHPITATGPEECLGLLWNTFLTPFFRGRMDAYRDWVFSRPVSEIDASYRNYERQLQILQWKISGEHWLLKSPAHLFGLDSLLRVLPDALVVTTHRDLRQVVPSFCSMTATMDRLYYSHVDPIEVGRRILHLVEQLLERYAAVQRTPAARRVIQVDYERLTQEPLAVVEQIYDKASLEFRDDCRRRVESFASQQRQKDRPQHRYSLDDFGLTEADVSKHLANVA